MSTPPPNNPLGTHRKAASYGRGWFEGTMGVISGMAPRPMTTSEGNRQRLTSLSAPNSPVRGGFPGINRLPSQDSLDRSIHNESGHGKSTAQIIKDLKKANSELTNKTAEMEVKFMNELATVTRPYEEKQHKMEDMLVAMKKQLAQLEAQKIAADSKIKEKDSQLSKIREESHFQRHTISDLKSQLHQLQSELDESDVDKTDEMGQLMAENEQMAQELEELRQQADLRDLRNSREATLSPASASAKEDGSDYFQQWQETQGELEAHHRSLTATKQDLANLKLEKDSWREQSNRVLELEDQLLSKSEQIQSMELESADDLQDQVFERDEEIASLNDQLEEYVEKAAELAAALAQVKEASVNQEQYRRDEAEDLRILHDAQEEEITKLRKELEDAQKEIEIKAEEMDDKDKTLKRSSDDKNEQIDRLKKELDDSHSVLDDSQKYLPPLAKKDTADPELIMEFEGQLGASRDKIASLEEEIELLAAEAGHENIEALELEIGDLKERLRDSKEDESVATAKLAVLEEDMTKLQHQLMMGTPDAEEKKMAETDSKAPLEDANAEINRLKGVIATTEAGDGSNEKLKKQLHEAQMALVALDEEKEELIKKHGEVLMAVEKQTQEIEKNSRNQLAAKDDELFVAIEQVANHHELETERDALKYCIESLEAQLAGSGSVGSLNEGVPRGESKSQIDALIEEKEELQNKLKDRDTTIAALVRSSMTVEDKIAALEDELHEEREARDDGRYTAGGEIDELRNAIETYKVNEQNMKEELVALDKDLNFAEADAKMWQLALQSDGTPGSDQKYQIAALQKNVAALRDKVKQRDDTIENLSLSNKKDPEIERLRAENDMFAGQIVEQDEEIHNLIREVRIRDQSLLELERDLAEKVDGEAGNDEDAREIQALQGQLAEIQSDLRIRNQQLIQFKLELENLRQQISYGGGGDPAMAADLTELQEINDEYLMELRQLRTELWEAKEATGVANDLRIELAQAQYAFDEYKRKQEFDVETVEQLKKELESTKSQLADAEDLEARLELVKTDRTSTEITLLESFERRTKEKDAVISTLKSDLELARGRTSEDFSHMANKLAELDSENSGLQEQFGVELHAKNQQIYALEQTLHAQEQIVNNMRVEMDQLQRGMVFATDRRRGDFEELQDEVYHMEEQAIKQEREIVNLRMKLEDAKLAHRAEVSQLTDLVRRKEQEAPIAKTVMELENEDRMLEVRERLESLNKHNTRLEEKNIKLGGRLERASIEIQSFASERQQVTEIEQDNRQLRNQLNDMDQVLKSYSQRPSAVTSVPLSTKKPPSVSVSLSKPKKLTKSTGSFGSLFKKKKKSKDKTGSIPTPVTPEKYEYDEEDDILQSSF
jgi:chromosome segregation ATPase